MPNFSDEQLVTLYLQGENQRFNELTLRYLKTVHNFIYRLIRESAASEDLTQETFVKAWKSLKKFDPKKKFKTWIFQIAKNTAIDYLRKHKTMVFSDLDNENEEERFEDTIADYRDSALQKLKDEELGMILEHSLKELDTEQQSIVILHLEEQMTFEEIAAVSKVSVNTVKSRYRRGIIKLKAVLAAKLTDAPKQASLT